MRLTLYFHFATVSRFVYPVSKKIFSFYYAQWNQHNGFQIYANNSRIILSPFQLDY